MKRILGPAVVGLTLMVGALLPSVATAVPPQFSDTVAFSGLNSPTSVAFAPDGRIFVAEQSGLIKVFDGVDDHTPTQVADLRTKVHGFWDRGLLSLIIDPSFPSRPYLYVSYTYDAAIGGTAPTWGVPNNSNDGCSSPPGATGDGCVVSGRLSRLTVSGNSVTAENVLINDWCQQYPSHSVGDLGFGADGNLYMSGGDGASFVFADFGQDGSPLNPCGDPPAGVGGVQTVATGEGGALRSQDIRTGGDPLGLDGTLIRVDPDSGRPVPDVAANATPSAVNTARVVAFGFRNPFRFAIRPGTNEVWVGDVGWGTVEEINRVIPGTAGTTANNFGWPCYEGPTYKPYSEFGFCQSLYSAGGANAPYFPFTHGVKVVPSETCYYQGGSSITGLEFYEGGLGSARFPSSYNGSLFFADYARGCIWVMKKGSNGLPDPSQVSMFQDTPGPVDLELAPDGSLFYVSLTGGTVHRIAYESQNGAPIARATASPDHGAAPLTVRLDGSGSSDPDPGDQLSYAWDLDEDGQFDDSTSVSPQKVYNTEGTYRPRLKVTDQDGASSTDDVPINVGAPPVPSIEDPADGDTFTANQTFDFSGSASDARDGSIPPSGLDWTAVLNHCTQGGGCHDHPMQNFDGVSGGQLAMPDHERPYYVTLTLTARDSDGLTASTSRDIYPSPNNTDTTPPNTTIDSGPSGPTNDPTPTFGFSADETGSSFECKVDSGSFSPCSPPETVASLPEGNHTLSVRATDPAGNTDSTPASRGFKVDTVAPTASVSCPPAPAPSKTSPVRCTASWNDPGGQNASGIPYGGIIYALDTDPGPGTNYNGHYYGGPFNVSGDGSWAVLVLAVDRAGNVSAFATVEVKIDTTPPNTTIDSGPSGPTNDPTPTFGFSADETGSSFECKVDSGSFSPCSPPETVASLPEGNHTLSVRATDPAGNTDSTPASRGFKVDTVAPTASVSCPPAPAPSKTSPVRCTASWNDPGGQNASGIPYGGIIYALDTDPGPGTNYNGHYYGGPFNVSGDGSWAVLVLAVDRAGNVSAFATVEVKIDTTNP